MAVYVERLDALAAGHILAAVRLVSPFLLRTVSPGLHDLKGARLTGVRRLGKRIVLELDDADEAPLFAVIHLMIAGRLRWRPDGAKRTARNAVALFDFDHGTLLFTEASKKKRASLHIVRGEGALSGFDRGGIDLRTATPQAFAAPFQEERHTLKRTLTDPRFFDGIGNAFSDEILWHAKLSPVRMSDKLTGSELEQLHSSAIAVLQEWTERTRAEVGDGFPEKVTAFRAEMAVHGKHKQPCPRCQTPVQRIVYAEHETNYCPTCQTGGKLLADRALSRLLKGDWPRTVTELEEIRKTGPKRRK